MRVRFVREGEDARPFCTGGGGPGGRRRGQTLCGSASLAAARRAGGAAPRRAPPSRARRRPARPGRGETCPVSTGGGTRRVQLVREGGGRAGGSGGHVSRRNKKRSWPWRVSSCRARLPWGGRWGTGRGGRGTEKRSRSHACVPAGPRRGSAFAGAARAPAPSLCGWRENTLRCSPARSRKNLRPKGQPPRRAGRRRGTARHGRLVLSRAAPARGGAARPGPWRWARGDLSGSERASSSDGT
jgi:hypothetical protein